MEIDQFEAMLKHASKSLTEEEMQLTSKRWLSNLQGVTFESWNHKLNQLSYPNYSIHLDRALIKW